MSDEQGSSRDRERARRKRMRKQGLRSIDFWIPDVTAPAIAAEARQQARAIAEIEGERQEMAALASLVGELPWWQETSDWDNEPGTR